MEGMCCGCMQCADTLRALCNMIVACPASYGPRLPNRHGQIAKHVCARLQACVSGGQLGCATLRIAHGTQCSWGLWVALQHN